MGCADCEPIDSVVIHVPLRPIATQSVRTTKSGHKYQPTRITKFKREVGAIAKLQLGKHWKPIEGEAVVHLDLDFALPKTAAKGLKKLVFERNEKVPMLSRPDVDNCTKGIFDALNGIAWIDDCQVRSVTTTKNYAKEDGITITLFIPKKEKETA